MYRIVPFMNCTHRRLLLFGVLIIRDFVISHVRIWPRNQLAHSLTFERLSQIDCKQFTCLRSLWEKTSQPLEHFVSCWPIFTCTYMFSTHSHQQNKHNKKGNGECTTQRRTLQSNNHPLGGKPLVVALFAPGRYYFILVNAPVFLLFLCFNSLQTMLYWNIWLWVLI